MYYPDGGETMTIIIKIRINEFNIKIICMGKSFFLVNIQFYISILFLSSSAE